MTRKTIAVFVVLCAIGCGKNSEGAKKMENGKNPVAKIETSMGTITVELFSDIAPLTVENFTGLAKGEKEFTDPKSGAKVKRPFYDGLIFHRVIPDFMIQGGCPRGDGTGGPGYQFEDECYDTKGAAKITGKIATEEDAIAVFQNILVPYFRSTKTPDVELVKIVNECQAAQSGKPLMKHDVEFYQKKTGNDKPLFGKGKLNAPVAYGTICMANSGPNTNGSQFFIVTKKGGCEWLNGKHTVFGKVISGMDVAEKIQNVERGSNDRPVKDVIINKISIE